MTPDAGDWRTWPACLVCGGSGLTRPECLDHLPGSECYVGPTSHACPFCEGLGFVAPCSEPGCLAASEYVCASCDAPRCDEHTRRVEGDAFCGSDVPTIFEFSLGWDDCAVRELLDARVYWSAGWSTRSLLLALACGLRGAAHTTKGDEE